MAYKYSVCVCVCVCVLGDVIMWPWGAPPNSAHQPPGFPAYANYPPGDFPQYALPHHLPMQWGGGPSDHMTQAADHMTTPVSYLAQPPEDVSGHMTSVDGLAGPMLVSHPHAR